MSSNKDLLVVGSIIMLAVLWQVFALNTWSTVTVGTGLIVIAIQSTLIRTRLFDTLDIHVLPIPTLTQHTLTFKLITGVFVYAMLKRYISTTTSHTIKTCGCNCGHNFYGYQGKRKTSKDELVIFVAKEVVTMNSSWPVCTFVFGHWRNSLALKYRS